MVNDKILEEKVKALEKRNQELEFEKWYLARANEIKDNLDRIHDNIELNAQQKISSFLHVLMKHFNLTYVGLYLRDDINFSENVPLKLELYNQGGIIYDLQSEDHPYLKQLSIQQENWLKQHNIDIDLEKVKDEFYPIKEGEIFVLYLNTNEDKEKTFGAVVGVANRKLKGVEKKLIRDDWEQHADTRIKVILGIQEKFGSYLGGERYDAELHMKLGESFIGAEPQAEKEEEPIGYEKGSYFDKNKLLLEERLNEIIEEGLNFNFKTCLEMKSPEELYPKEEQVNIVKLVGKLALKIGDEFLKEIDGFTKEDQYAMVFMALYAFSAPYLKDEKGNQIVRVKSKNKKDLTNALKDALPRVIPKPAQKEYFSLYQKLIVLARTINDEAEKPIAKQVEKITKMANAVEASLSYSLYCHKTQYTNGTIEITKQHTPDQALDWLKKHKYVEEAEKIEKYVLAPKKQ